MSAALHVFCRRVAGFLLCFSVQPNTLWRETTVYLLNTRTKSARFLMTELGSMASCFLFHLLLR